MRYSLFILIFSFGIFSLKSSAQEKRTIEFLVTQEMDTLFGIVERVTNVFSKKNSLIFYSESENQSKLYDISEVIAYQNQYEKLFLRKEFWKGDSVEYKFLELLISGEINLYKDFSNFYVEKGDEIYKLENTFTDRRDEVDRTFRKHNREYIATLSVLMGGCVQLYEEINNSKYDYNDLSFLIVKYHECVDKEYRMIISKKKNYLDFSFNYGVSFIGFYTNSLNIIPNYRPQEIQSLENKNVGIGLDFYFTASRKIPAYLILSPQLTFNNNFSTAYNFDLTAIWKRYYALELQYNQLNLPLGIGYALKFKSIQPFVEAGLAYSYAWNVNYQYEVYSKSNQGDTQPLVNNSYSLDPFWNKGYWFSFGIEYSLFRKFNLFNKLTYQAVDFSSDNQEIESTDKKYNQQQYQLVFGVKF